MRTNSPVPGGAARQTSGGFVPKPLVALVVLLAFGAYAGATPERKVAASGARRSLGIGCVSVSSGWKVSLEQHDGWVSGQIENPGNAGLMAFAIVTGTGAPAASPARREQFEWFKTEKLGGALLHYGLERKSDGRPVLQATVIGGGVTANFVGPQRDRKSLPDLLTVARSYSPEKCPQ